MLPDDTLHLGDRLDGRAEILRCRLGDVLRERHRLRDLLYVMRAHDLAPPEKVAQLKAELNRYHHTQAFDRCDSMGDIVRQNLWLMLGAK